MKPNLNLFRSALVGLVLSACLIPSLPAQAIPFGDIFRRAEDALNGRDHEVEERNQQQELRDREASGLVNTLDIGIQEAVVTISWDHGIDLDTDLSGVTDDIEVKVVKLGQTVTVEGYHENILKFRYHPHQTEGGNGVLYRYSDNGEVIGVIAVPAMLPAAPVVY